MTILRTTFRSLAGVSIVAGLTTGAGAADATATAFAVGGTLNGVAALSARAAWAVGTTTSGRALVLHWNGDRWSKSTPVAGALSAVTAVSATNVWAVGTTAKSRSLIVHWNGRRWTRVASPSPGRGATLSGIAATSAGNLWAVGGYFATSERTLTLHWTGTAWHRVPSPPGDLFAVAVTSARDVWAVGSRFVAKLNAGRTLALHWNGHSWKRAATPGPVGNGAGLGGVTAPAGRTWAVGCTGCGIGGFANSVTARWTHGAWRVPSGGRVSGGELTGVATASNGSAWAVGGRYATPGDIRSVRTFIRFWNGRTWTTRRAASPGREATLRAVAATSPTNAWAVGSYQRSAGNGGGTRTLIMHWNGTSWR